jgi:single-stranded DNA-binding protein
MNVATTINGDLVRDPEIRHNPDHLRNLECSDKEIE